MNNLCTNSEKQTQSQNRVNHITDIDTTEIDTAWIQDFKKLETEYNDFYKEIPTTANICNLYINKNNNLVSVTHDTIILNKYGRINKDQIIYIVKKNKAGF